MYVPAHPFWEEITTSRWIKSPKRLHLILSLDESGFLCILVDWLHSKIKREKLARRKGWFYFPDKIIRKKLPKMTYKKCLGIFKRLAKKGIVSTKMTYEKGKISTSNPSGFQNHRLIFIHFDNLEKILRDAETKQGLEFKARRKRTDKSNIIREEDCDRTEYILYLRSLPYEKYLITGWWKMRRRQELKAAGFHCSNCMECNRKLHVHHKTYERLGEELSEDLAVLCDVCHGAIHGITVPD
jgi:hypothetical protein